MIPPVLSRRLVLEEAQLTPDGAGGMVRSWNALGTHWAEMRFRSGREANVGTVTTSTNAYRITVRAASHDAASRPKPEQRFREGVRIFRIVAVLENNDQGRYLTCLAEEEAAS